MSADHSSPAGKKKTIDKYALAMHIAMAGGAKTDWSDIATKMNATSAASLSTTWLNMKKAFLAQEGGSTGSGVPATPKKAAVRKRKVSAEEEDDDETPKAKKTRTPRAKKTAVVKKEEGDDEDMEQDENLTPKAKPVRKRKAPTSKATIDEDDEMASEEAETVIMGEEY